MNDFCLNTENIKRVYNWFYHGFPDYKKNEKCMGEDIILMRKMEMFILENEQPNQ